VVKVLDFGIAKIADVHRGARLTTEGMLGTLPYMSPEQMRDSRAVDPRSDLWSLGVILYRMLTGSLPFPGNGMQVMMQVQHEKAPPPSSVAPDLPAWVDPFFARALARRPDERFQSAQELATAFCVLATGVPPRAAWPSSASVDPDEAAAPPSKGHTTQRIAWTPSGAPPARRRALVAWIAVGAGGVLVSAVLVMVHLLRAPEKAGPASAAVSALTVSVEPPAPPTPAAPDATPGPSQRTLPAPPSASPATRPANAEPPRAQPPRIEAPKPETPKPGPAPGRKKSILDNPD
jgi:serine/threonine-protein kinase